MGETTMIEGSVDAGFEPVRQTFAENFTAFDETGASCAVYVDGELKVDLWGGVADVKTGRPWTEDTLVLVYSATKGATSVLCHRLAQEGLLDLDAPVVKYWPEFGEHGKAGTTPRMLLSHEAGLPLLETALPRERLLEGSQVADVLAAQPPMWEPGTGYGYHALTFGWLLGELVRRVTGESLGAAFAAKIAAPLGLDFFIGLPDGQERRVAGLVDAPPPDPAAIEAIADPDLRSRMIEALTPGSLFLRVLSTNGALPTPSAEAWNDPAVWRAEQPATNGITNARSLARMYASCVGEVDGVRILNDETTSSALRHHDVGPDRLVPVSSRHGTGFQLPDAIGPMLSDASFGHSGAGGALGFGDRRFKVAFGYAQNQLGGGLTGEQPRTIALVEALRGCLDP